LFFAHDQPLSNFTTLNNDDWFCLDWERQETLSSAPSEEQHDVAVDDSLFDTEDNMDVNADEAQKESDAEAHQIGVLEVYLVEVLDCIKAKIQKSGAPECYFQGTFWINPHDPVFALHASSAHSTNLSPKELYHLDVFLWVPDHLPGTSSLKCVCGQKLTHNGWNENPIARQVKHLHQDYFLLTNHLQCERPGGGCGQNFQGTDSMLTS
jgi:hypothetical protein